MIVYLGADHGGFVLKEKIKSFLIQKGYEVVDFGALALHLDDDYPDFVLPVARAISRDIIENKESRGIILGRSGQGEAMAANRIDGIRATVYYGGSKDIVMLSREKNNANVLSLGSDLLVNENIEEIILTWLTTPFSNDPRHLRRIAKF